MTNIDSSATLLFNSAAIGRRYFISTRVKRIARSLLSNQMQKRGLPKHGGRKPSSKE